MTDDERIVQYAGVVRRQLACPPAEAEARGQELVEHLRDAADAGALDEAFHGLGSAEQAAAAFARERSASDAPLARRFGAALLDNLPLVLVSVALAVRGLSGATTVLAFPPHVYFEAGGACVALTPGGGCVYDDPGLLYTLALPLALAWSILGLGVMESRLGGSPGKLLFNLRVVTEDGLRIRPAVGVLRRLSFLVGPLAWLDWTPLLLSRRRRVMEYLARTRVIVAPVAS
ncbi:RDD family protein [Phytohabitans kaempferiae]|uniref:RDD family protein n=1 Tax=Phytohabitans kaempferiae TaxID=1620943 RepID=A0ABV6MBU4_9ACTN